MRTVKSQERLRFQLFDFLFQRLCSFSAGLKPEPAYSSSSSPSFTDFFFVPAGDLSNDGGVSNVDEWPLVEVGLPRMEQPGAK